MKKFPSLYSIIHCINTNYPVNIKSISPLSLGADINASVFKAEAHDKSSFFVKLKYGHHEDINAVILGLMHRTGIKQIIPPLNTRDGHLVQNMNDFSLILYPFIVGVDGFTKSLSDKQWFILGKVLKQVHELTLPSSILSKVRKETYSSQWRKAVRSLLGYMEGGIASDDSLSLNFLNSVKKHLQDIQRLVDRAEQLCHKVREQSPEFVLCHSDIHGGNVLLQGKDNIYIVDWDEPIMAPKERDLMFIGGGIANVWNDPQEEVIFYKGYGKTEINRTILAYYRYERIVQDIAEFTEALLLNFSAHDNKDRAEMYTHFLNMFEPRGVVEIAYNTDVRC